MTQSVTGLGLRRILSSTQTAVGKATQHRQRCTTIYLHVHVRRCVLAFIFFYPRTLTTEYCLTLHLPIAVARRHYPSALRRGTYPAQSLPNVPLISRAALRAALRRLARPCAALRGLARPCAALRGGTTTCVLPASAPCSTHMHVARGVARARVLRTRGVARAASCRTLSAPLHVVNAVVHHLRQSHARPWRVSGRRRPRPRRRSPRCQHVPPLATLECVGVCISRMPQLWPLSSSRSRIALRLCRREGEMSTPWNSLK